MFDFTFLNPGELRDGELRLVLREVIPPMANRPPGYRFEMRRYPDGEKLGRTELRIGSTPDLLCYTGQIGYCVEPDHRGHRYAARSCQLLRSLAKLHRMTEAWITCDPDNAASRRSCELAGAEFVAIVTVPVDHPIYRAGGREKCRYRLPV